MPRPNAGPRLVLARDKRATRAIWIIRWTEGGRKLEKSTGCDAADIREARTFFEAWLSERRRASRTGPGDPDQVQVADILIDYAGEHGGEVASPATLAGAIEPLLAFFKDDTIATLTTERVKEYWGWRRRHSIHALDRERTEVEIVDRGASDVTIIRELGGTLRPAIRHAIEQRRLVPGTYYVPVPQAPPGRDYWITRPEAARLLWETRRDKRARLHLPLYSLIALYTGARRGAILELTWKQVDLVRGPDRLQSTGTRAHQEAAVGYPGAAEPSCGAAAGAAARYLRSRHRLPGRAGCERQDWLQQRCGTCGDPGLYEPHPAAHGRHLDGAARRPDAPDRRLSRS